MEINPRGAPESIGLGNAEGKSADERNIQNRHSPEPVKKINFMSWVAKSADDFQRLSNRSGEQNPWKTTAPTYILNPLVNLGLTAVHGAKTLEKTAKVGYYLVTSIVSSSGVILSLGKNKKIKEECLRQWIFLAANATATVYSLSYTITNVWEGIRGLFEIQKATRNEAHLVEKQRQMDAEMDLLHYNVSDSKKLSYWLWNKPPSD
ncbi:MAG: hypothetical protein ACH350_06605 [Parachlamydiaceae bacterium]